MNLTPKAPHTRAVTAAIALAGLVTFGAVGFAHADNDVPTSSSSPSTQADTSTSTDPTSAPSATDRIGLVSVTQVAADNTTPVEGSVIQLERLSDTAAPTTDTASDSTTTTPSEPATTDTSTSPTTSTSTSTASALAFPVGAKFDVVTSKNAVILALPEGIYKLTHLGTANNEQAPNAGDVTIRVIAGRHVAGKLQEQPGTTRGAAPGVSSAAADTSTSASTSETAAGE